LMVLESLGSRFPHGEITVLTDPDILDELSQHPRVSDTAVYSNLRVFLARQLWELRRQEYDCKVALFTNENEGRYNKFKALAFMCRAPRMIVYNENGDSFEWDYRHRRIIWSHIKWRLRDKFFSGASLQQDFFVLLLKKLASLLLLPFAFIRLLCSVGWLFARRWFYESKTKPPVKEGASGSPSMRRCETSSAKRDELRLSVIMPVHNELHTIREALRQVQAVDLEKEIIIVDDHSSDGTREILGQIADDEVEVVYHAQNMGKGSAIKTALQYVTGELIIIQDGDLEYDPADYHKLIEPIVEGRASVVYGSRFLGEITNMHFSNYIANKILALTASLLFLNWITDEGTCYKVFKTDLLKSLDLECTGFDFCPEVTAKVRKRGYKIVEVPISYRGRSTDEGKKIRWQDGLRAFLTLIKYRLVN
jgi:dolichol-phosphate mannosyltransferase